MLPKTRRYHTERCNLCNFLKWKSVLYLLRELMEAEAIDSCCIFSTIIPYTVNPLKLGKGKQQLTLEWHGISFEQLSGWNIFKTKADYYTHCISFLQAYMFLSVCYSFAKYLFFQLYKFFIIQRNKPVPLQTCRFFYLLFMPCNWSLIASWPYFRRTNHKHNIWLYLWKEELYEHTYKLYFHEEKCSFTYISK